MERAASVPGLPEPLWQEQRRAVAPRGALADPGTVASHAGRHGAGAASQGGMADASRLLRRAVLRAAGAALGLAAVPAIGAGLPMIVRCPRAENDIDQVNFDLLRLALNKAPGAYAARAWPLQPMRIERNRALQELLHGEHLDVVWAVTSGEREAALLPVRIPLDKGMTGWRLALVRQSDLGRFAAIGQVADLAHFQAGLGYDWAETAVLRANGLPVVTGNNTDRLHAMLAAHRFDYFPRPVRQAWVEARQHASLSLAVEPHLALHFPSAVYFFVNPANTELAGVLEQGLRNAIADGSFERKFQESNGPYIQRAALAQRRILRLHNPALPPATPLGVRDFWYLPPFDGA